MPYLYVGNRRKGPSSWEKQPAATGYGFGIHRFDAASGALTLLGTVAEDISVGAAIHDPSRDIVYAVDEALTLPGHHLGGGGQVIAFRVDRNTGNLIELNRQPSYGTLPCHIALDTRGEFLLLVNHTGHTPVTRPERNADGTWRIVLDYDEAGTVLYPLGNDGSIAAPCDIHRHSGSGALPAQTHPQLHSVVRAPGHDLFVVCDKGCDRIHLFGLDRAARKLVVGNTITAPPGSSPRYSVFHPRLPLFFVNFETAPLLAVYRYDIDGGVTPIQTINIPADPRTMQSDLVLHPNGRWLYGLVRGLEAVVVHEIDEQDGTLRHVQTLPLGVANARGAAVSPDGRHFLVAAAVSREVRVFPIEADGRLAAEGQSHPQPAPGSLLFVS